MSISRLSTAVVNRSYLVERNILIERNKRARTIKRSSSFQLSSLTGLLRFGCVNGANVRAVAAVDALIGVDYVNAGSLADRFGRAFRRTSAAADAFFGNLICHDAFLRIQISLTL